MYISCCCFLIVSALPGCILDYNLADQPDQNTQEIDTSQNILVDDTENSSEEDTFTGNDTHVIIDTEDTNVSVQTDNDECPDDPDKTFPGLCGCGVPDVDSDGDGTPDCTDGCLSDPDKAEPGICGCGAPELDSDSDGACDLSDQCEGNVASGDADHDGMCNDIDPTWVTMTAMPFSSGGLASAVLSDGLHVLGGGEDWGGIPTLTNHYVYRDASDTWSSSPAQIPDSETWGAQAQVHDDRLYLVGGWYGDKAGKKLRVYDPNNNAWEALADIPTPFQSGFVSAVVGNFLYVIGGLPNAAVNGSAYKFNLVSQTWSEVTPIPQNDGRGSLAGAALGRKIYVLNGDAAGGSTILQIYNTESDSWSQGANLDKHFEVASSLTFGNKVYFFGGAVQQYMDPPIVVSKIVNIYDPGADSWSKGIAMPTARHFSTAQMLNGHFHVLGGLDANCNAVSVHEIFYF